MDKCIRATVTHSPQLRLCWPSDRIECIRATVTRSPQPSCVCSSSPWVVYQSDGYPQSTAEIDSGRRVVKVYQSDGYPQSTAGVLRACAGAECIRATVTRSPQLRASRAG